MYTCIFRCTNFTLRLTHKCGYDEKSTCAEQYVLFLILSLGGPGRFHISVKIELTKTGNKFKRVIYHWRGRRGWSSILV